MRKGGDSSSESLSFQRNEKRPGSVAISLGERKDSPS